MISNRLQWLCLWLMLTTAGAASAQALDPDGNGTALAGDADLPAWVVPVLRLVSATHVEPTTGIVLSGSGLVLVPADFARIGDEVIVLDGGTDIISNGRPARLEMSFPEDGVKVLAVDGLRRSGAKLPQNLVANGAEVMLAAFPPAEQIEQGRPPLSEPATLVVFAETGNPAVSAETPLPNVTGPLIDACGNLVGVSLAHDVQTMEHSAETRYAWLPALQRVYTGLGIEPATSGCPEATAGVTETPEPEPELAEPAAVEAPSTPEETAEAAGEESDGENDAGETDAADTETPAIDILPPIEREPGAAPPQEKTGGRAGFWLLAAALFFGLGLWLHRWRREPAPELEGTARAQPTPPILPEPGSLEAEGAGSALDHHLQLTGLRPDGTEFTARCPVSAQAVNVLIGRGGADLAIDSPAVSRRHACLNGRRGALTLTDLGSSNGTSINGVPVMEGEVMYVEPGDTVVLGNVCCRFEIRRDDEAPEEES